MSMAVTEIAEEDLLALIKQIMPDAEFVGDDEGFLHITTHLMYTGWNGENLIGDVILDGEGVCFRCKLPVTSRWELVVLDGEERNDCPESEDGLPHEVGEPE